MPCPNPYGTVIYSFHISTREVPLKLTQISHPRLLQLFLAFFDLKDNLFYHIEITFKSLYPLLLLIQILYITIHFNEKWKSLVSNIPIYGWIKNIIQSTTKVYLPIIWWMMVLFWMIWNIYFPWNCGSDSPIIVWSP